MSNNSSIERKALDTNDMRTTKTAYLRDLRDDLYYENRNGQEQWQKEMMGVTQLKDREVAVLLFSWDKDREHSMNTEAELRDLTNVFQNKFNFKVHKKLLSTQKPQKPRYQLNSIIIDFLSEYDKPGNLVIIYYGGHGMPSENGEELRLLGGNPSESDRESTELTWNHVERNLYEISADLLLIFDCCFAGLVARNKRVWPASKSHFEFIGSTGFDKPARGPKSQGSFTRGMILALDSLSVVGHFTPTALVAKIMESEAFRKTLQQPVIDECGKTNSYRLKIVVEDREATPVVSSPVHKGESVNFYLHLKYVFRQKPSSQDIKALAERLDDLVRNDRLPIADVLWEGLSEYNPRMRMEDAARQLQARLGHQFRKSAGRLELSASTEKPIALPQRTLTTLTMDHDLVSPKSTSKAGTSPPYRDGSEGSLDSS